ncbi:hypothetical protein GGX14DRAFT_328220, partial [Mycena pura]
MLSFGLKLVWFSLSLSGVIGCWAVLLPLAWATQSYWAPLSYAVAITGLQGIFCIGLVWGMNPPAMPVPFCLVQVIVAGLAASFLAGVLAAITSATTVYVAKPKQWGTQNGTAVFKWQSYYLVPMGLFPLLATTVQATFVIYFATFNNADGMTCAPHPLWLRFLGYAGPPFLITIPCLWLTLLSVLRVLRTYQHIRRARRSVDFAALDRFTALPQRMRKSRSQ